MDLTTMRTRVRADLKDSGSAKWSNDELDRAIARAVGEYQRAAPLLAYTDKALVANTYRYDCSAATGYMWCEAVEYPIDEDEGPVYLAFREESVGSIFILRMPSLSLTAGQNCRFWYAKAHTLAGTSTIYVEDEELVELGATAFAALQWSMYSIDRIGASGWTPRQYREFGDARMEEFRKRLELVRQTRVSRVGGYVVHWGESV